MTFRARIRHLEGAARPPVWRPPSDHLQQDFQAWQQAAKSGPVPWMVFLARGLRRRLDSPRAWDRPLTAGQVEAFAVWERSFEAPLGMTLEEAGVVLDRRGVIRQIREMIEQEVRRRTGIHGIGAIRRRWPRLPASLKEPRFHPARIRRRLGHTSGPAG